MSTPLPNARFIERINRKTDTLNAVFCNDTESRPQSYVSSRSSFTPSRLSRTSSQSQKTASTPPPSSGQLKEEVSNLEQRALPKDSLVLVTGANSFLGSHVVDQLLNHGYRVRGAVRDHEKAAWTCTYFEDKYGPDRYTTSLVPDMTIKGAFDDAVEDCTGVVHVASITTMSADPNEVIVPSIAGVLNALEAAANEPSVLRFVLTSSVAAAISQDRNECIEVTSDSWNFADLSSAWAPPPYEEDRAFAVYNSSKMQTEAVVKKWYEDREPSFVLNTVLPDTLWGRMLDPIHQEHPLSVMILKSVFDGEPVYYPPCHFVDVQDAALLHVTALVLPDVKDQRIFATAESWNMTSLAQDLKRLYPNRKIEDGMRDIGTAQTVFTEADKAEEILKRIGRKGWTELETSLQRSCEAFF